MRSTRLIWISAGMLVAAPLVMAQPAAEDYKLGMFRQAQREFIGMVVDDEQVIDLARADPAVPGTLKEFIAHWDDATASRLAALAANVRRNPPGNALRVGQLEILPPIADPDSILMAARNYVDHANEMASVGRTLGTTSTIDAGVLAGLPGLWTRAVEDQRPNPYLFPKLKSSLSATSQPIVLPPGRTNIDYECELVAVIGRPARRVPVDVALDYVFGYMVMNDISDRQERADGRYGSDWLAGKSQDSFGPSGPFIVPAAFVGDPQNLNVRLTLNGELMQDGNTAQMVHTVRDLVAYASSIATLQPGDLIGTGTPGGVGEGRVPPVYLKAGDRVVCTIEKIGALENPVQALN